MKEKFKGVFPALLTPFGKNGAINTDSIKKLVEFNVKKGVNGFYVGGSSGEGLLLTVRKWASTLSPQLLPTTTVSVTTP